jgi:hypothetical protein
LLAVVVVVEMETVAVAVQVVIEHQLEHQGAAALPNQHLPWLYQPTIRLLSVVVAHLDN